MEIKGFNIIDKEIDSAAGGTRTLDITVFSRALSQLSYRGKTNKIKKQKKIVFCFFYYNVFISSSVVLLISPKIFLSKSIVFDTSSVVIAPCGDGSMSPSCSSIRKE